MSTIRMTRDGGTGPLPPPPPPFPPSTYTDPHIPIPTSFSFHLPATHLLAPPLTAPTSLNMAAPPPLPVRTLTHSPVSPLPACRSASLFLGMWLMRCLFPDFDRRRVRISRILELEEGKL
ncbi:hypothetical protein L202_01617 [Cryptococcus amylolentus CBS 6039]|uniref:Uncharacterized protein n=1 Tax=Cryptococcus amylolentus CBS 6039 TaxID=1295533 RepID=A0A1E3I485_9TREE|nr:hypothetical protein L202_01617 [Cryptococcus amylolentus CBS 6039]ODN83480.1 hypothetical protein L202_01617 [Cryptococcus amylolentus CBS 6039]